MPTGEINLAWEDNSVIIFVKYCELTFHCGLVGCNDGHYTGPQNTHFPCFADLLSHCTAKVAHPVLGN